MCSKNILTGLVALFATFSLGVLASVPFAPFSVPTVTVAEPVSVRVEKPRKCLTGKDADRLVLEGEQTVVHLTTAEEDRLIREAEKSVKQERPSRDSKR